MSFVSDAALERLSAVARRPDFAHPRYDVLEEIGRGGMGTVFLGRDGELERDVAIKVTHAASADSALEERVRREARVLADLEHPGIVPIHDVGMLADGRLFVVMKLVRGVTLDAHLARVAEVDERLRLFERIAEPVAFAHARGYVHRDIKPSNVMVGGFGEVLVMDWGLALKQGLGVGGQGSGTDGWMAPEQVTGGPVDQRADVFALGKLLEALVGAAAPKRLRAICARATAATAADRYPNAAALAADVVRFRTGQPVDAWPENLLDRAVRLAGRYRTALILIVAYLIMRVLIAVFFGR